MYEKSCDISVACQLLSVIRVVEPSDAQLKVRSKFSCSLTNKNGIPFHDREQITNFQKYHEKITAIFQIEK